MFLLVLQLVACDLFDPENLGIYTCDEYCNQVLDKTDECAEAECSANAAECGDYSEEDLSAYAAEGREDWEGASKKDMVASCNDDLDAAGKTDSECQAETAVVNNLSCDDVLSLIGGLQDG